MGRWDGPYRLYWSNIEAYNQCPQKFLWSRGWKGIDVGGGVGRRKPVLERRSEHHALMGEVIGSVFERLYNDELWRHPDTLQLTLKELTRKEFGLRIQNRFIEYRRNASDTVWYKSPPDDELLQTCQDGILGYLKTLKHNKILGEYARCEVNLSTSIDDKYNHIGGRADLIVRSKSTGITIYDGKNSGTVGRWTNPDQLRWYALCFYQAYKVMPDHLFFIYYRYPYGTPLEKIKGDPPEGEWTGLVDVPFTMEDLKGLAETGRDIHKKLWKQKFAPTPSTKNCKFCDYENVCDARKAQKNARKRNRTVSPTEKKITEAGGFVNLSFGD